MTIADAQELTDALTLSDDDMLALARELSALPQHPYHEKARTIAGSDQDQLTPDGTRNPLWEIVRYMPGDAYYEDGGRIDPNGYWAGGRDGEGQRRAHAAGLGRIKLCSRYAWSIPSPGDIRWISDLAAGRGIVEIGAGAGYWAWQLAQVGVDVAAYDPHAPGVDNEFAKHGPYHPVRSGDHTAVALHPDRVLMLCWPSYGEPFAKEALHHYTGDTVIYIGEGEGGCCADDRFHRILRRDFKEIGSSPFHVTYWGIYCRLTAWRRRAGKDA